MGLSLMRCPMLFPPKCTLKEGFLFSYPGLLYLLLRLAIDSSLYGKTTELTNTRYDRHRHRHRVEVVAVAVTTINVNTDTDTVTTTFQFVRFCLTEPNKATDSPHLSDQWPVNEKAVLAEREIFKV